MSLAQSVLLCKVTFRFAGACLRAPHSEKPKDADELDALTKEQPGKHLNTQFHGKSHQGVAALIRAPGPHKC